MRQQVRHPHLFSLSTSFSFFLSFFLLSSFSSLYFLIFNFRFSYCWRSVGRQFNYKFKQASEALERRGEERRGEERRGEERRGEERRGEERRGEERRGEERRGEERRGEERRGEERRGEERRGEERRGEGTKLPRRQSGWLWFEYLPIFRSSFLFIYLFICCLFLNLLADYLWRMRRSHHYYHLRNCQQMQKMRVIGGSFRHGRRRRRGRQAEDRGEITGCQEEGTRGMGGDEGDRRRCQRETLREGRVRQLSRWSSQVK